MRIWTYIRPFQYENQNYEVKFFCSFTTYTSQVFHNGILIDELSGAFKDGFKALKHRVNSANHIKELTISVGYISWWSIGIEAREDGELFYASHPGKDIHFAESKIVKYSSSETLEELNQKRKLQNEKWQKNKYSLFADIVLGAAFFIVAKVTDDLTIAAFTGVFLGLLLVVIQRFVKVDLLGGFAVFGTIMLLISGMFSLVFQSEHLVQIKGTVLGLLTASILMIDAAFRKGRYFGPRFERYLNSSVNHQFFVFGLALIGAFMAGLNYAIATYLSVDFWLTYTTFIDTPLYFIMLAILIWQAGKQQKQSVQVE